MIDLTTRLQGAKSSDSYSYLFSLPEGGEGEGATRWPLLLFLHGMRERGTDVWAVTRQGLPRLLHGQPELTPAERETAEAVAAKFVVIAPQCPPDEVWDTAALLALLDDVGSQIRLDDGRLYLTGLSMGGFGTWAMGMKFPRRFAAIAPICGGGRIADLTAALSTESDALRTLGVWAFHGAKDRVVPLEESERMVAALKSAGARDVRLTIYPEVQHDAWNVAYSNRELYSWLLAHTR